VLSSHLGAYRAATTQETRTMGCTIEVYQLHSIFEIPTSLGAALDSDEVRGVLEGCSTIERPEALRDEVLRLLVKSSEWTDDAELFRWTMSGCTRRPSPSEPFALADSERVLTSTERILGDCRAGDTWLTVAPSTEVALWNEIRARSRVPLDRSIQVLPMRRCASLFPSGACSFEDGIAIVQEVRWAGAMLVGVDYGLAATPERADLTEADVLVEIRVEDGQAWLEHAPRSIHVEIVDLDWGADVDIESLRAQIAATPQIPWGSVGYRQAHILDALDSLSGGPPADVVVLVRLGVPSVISVPEGVHVRVTSDS
jgi:hypothetical protein